LNGACGNFYGKLDSGIRSFQKLDGENEDLTLILRKKMEMFADTSAFNAGVKEKNTKRERLYMLPKGKFICMLKRKFCVAIFRFLTIVILFVFVFFSFTPALKALVSTKRKQGLQI
jgi:hypothetical protein